MCWIQRQSCRSRLMRPTGLCRREHACVLLKRLETLRRTHLTKIRTDRTYLLKTHHTHTHSLPHPSAHHPALEDLLSRLKEVRLKRRKRISKKNSERAWLCVCVYACVMHYTQAYSSTHILDLQ